MARGQVLAILAERFLESGTARSRAKHQVVIHRSSDGQAWYETERGALPVAPQVLEQAEKSRIKPSFADDDSRPRPGRASSPLVLDTEVEVEERDAGQSACQIDKKGVGTIETEVSALPGRKEIATGVLRSVFTRASHRCERCGDSSTPLHVHHQRPVSEGGTNDIAGLELLCWPCHAGHHDADYQTKPHWATARRKATPKNAPP